MVRLQHLAVTRPDNLLPSRQLKWIHPIHHLLFAAAAKEQSTHSDPAPVGLGKQLLRVLASWRFWLFYGINQLGSVLYNYLLGTTDLALASPVCNSLTFVFTAITAALLGEKQPLNWRTVLGTMLIIAGVALCVVAKLDTVL